MRNRRSFLRSLSAIPLMGVVGCNQSAVSQVCDLPVPKVPVEDQKVVEEQWETTQSKESEDSISRVDVIYTFEVSSSRFEELLYYTNHFAYDINKSKILVKHLHLPKSFRLRHKENGTWYEKALHDYDKDIIKFRMFGSVDASPIETIRDYNKFLSESSNGTRDWKTFYHMLAFYTTGIKQYPYSIVPSHGHLNTLYLYSKNSEMPHDVLVHVEFV